MKTFFFYDLETSGISPKKDQIMQFAGQRTDLELNPLGQPVNFLIKMNRDRLPSIFACLITGLTPQETLPDGFTELEACHYLTDEIFTENTIAIGFNNMRFDNAFLQYMFFRNFFDPYEWCWKDGRESWDILDMVRMVRALRPDGIEWPVNEKGKATNRLELIAKVNHLEHEKAHDALSDVDATIAVAKLIRDKQPKLFDWLFSVRSKKAVAEFVSSKQPFVYTSGRYDEKFNKTTAVLPISVNHREALVWDLRYDPRDFTKKTDDELRDLIFIWNNQKMQKRLRDGEVARIPVKSLKFNKAPAIAPLGVLDNEGGWTKLQLDKKQIEENANGMDDFFAERLTRIMADRPKYAGDKTELPPIAEEQLYDGFCNDADKKQTEIVRQVDKNLASKWLSEPAEAPKFLDVRLNEILPRFLARNFYDKLPKSSKEAYDHWRQERLRSVQATFKNELTSAITTNADEKDTQKQNHNAFVLENLRLWLDDVLD